MIKHYRYSQLGKANHGWLRANHHFSFAHYYNKNRMGFGTLRVVNDDWVAPGTGFATHPHRNMEIISFIRTGSITHEDSEGNKGITTAGEVQVMSAGSGISHSEYNRSSKPLTLYQIWIEPNKLNVTPRWDSKKLSSQSHKSKLPLLVSGYEEDKDKALFIHQKARIYGGKIVEGAKITMPIEHQAYLLASTGNLLLIDNENTVEMQKGDGAEITFQKEITIQAKTDTELIIIDAPVH